jgi:hypothetical protein
MVKDGFTEVQQKLEAIALELKNENEPDRRRMLLKEMSRLLAEAQRIIGQPPKNESIIPAESVWTSATHMGQQKSNYSSRC